jgi:transposase/predicted HTH domain antitoxin
MTAMRRARHNSFSEAQCARIVHLYQEQKLSVERIAERMESNSMSVWRTLKRRGVEIRYNARQSMSATANVQTRRLPALADVVRLYTVELMSSTTIAERYGCHAQSIRHMLKGSGVSIRGKVEAALLSASEWTDERVALLRELWPTGMKCDEIRDRLGISYTSRAVSRKADELGLPKRNNQPKRPPKPAAVAVAEHKPKPRIRSLVTFLPESPRLEMEFRHLVAKVRAERGAQWTELLGVERA